MQLTLLKSKIHRATVTGASLDYEGSLTVSADLAELVGLIPYEKILVANLSNGDRVTIMSFARVTPEEAAVHRPLILVLNEKNVVVRYDEDASVRSFKVVAN